MGISHGDRPTPFDDIVVHRRRLTFGSPFKTTVVYHGIKGGGGLVEAKSEICRSDTYLAISTLCKL